MALETAHAYRPQTQTGRIVVGTSGWSYRHWRGLFYPERLAGGAALAYYVARFATVEVNRTFYSLPEAATIERWRDPVDGAVCYIYLPIAVEHQQGPNNLVQYGSSVIGTISCYSGRGWLGF